MNMRWAIGVGLMAAAWAVPTGAALAGKPSGGGGGGGGATPPGTIYFRDGSDVTSMDGSGGNRTALTGLTFGTAGTYRPSRLLHGGSRWFLHLETVFGESSPRGGIRSDLFAVREDGSVRVRLTSDPTIEYQYSCDWGGDESASGATIAVVAGRWTGPSLTDTVIPGSCGLYTATLAFDGTGHVVGLDAEPALAVPLDVRGAAGEETPDVYNFIAWSPDTTRIAFAKGSYPSNSAHPLLVADVSTGAVTSIGLGEEPSWAPDGLRIACSRLIPGSSPSRDVTVIETVRPDGTDRTMLVSRRRSQGTTSHPRWSPDGAYIAYQHLPDDYSSNGVSFIRRITVSGSGDTNLTPSGVSYQAALKDWR